MLLRSARGARINGMIDFTSGWLVANIGHDNRAVMRAASKAKGWAVLQSIKNPIREKAEDVLRSILPSYLKEIAFYNSGSEAIDAVIRLAGLPVVTHACGHHGSTIGASMERPHVIKKGTAVLLEPFLGPWCQWHSPTFIDRIRDNVVIFDEMQTGFGRTGKWWGFEHYDIKPSFVVGGKAAAGGFPFAFVAGRKFNGPTYESTFSGNAICCAAFIETVNQIKKRRLIERVCENEHLIQEAFPQARGKGYAYAFDCDNAREVVGKALGRGLLLLDTGKNTIKICPPLCISRADLKRGLEIIKSSV